MKIILINKKIQFKLKIFKIIFKALAKIMKNLFKLKINQYKMKILIDKKIFY